MNKLQESSIKSNVDQHGFCYNYRHIVITINRIHTKISEWKYNAFMKAYVRLDTFYIRVTMQNNISTSLFL